MLRFLYNKVPSSIAITVIIFAGTVSADYIFIKQYQAISQNTNREWLSTTNKVKGESQKEKECEASGGKIEIITCYCSGPKNFFNSCLIGGCACTPDPKYSREIKTCDCGEGRCFDGDECVDFRNNI